MKNIRKNWALTTFLLLLVIFAIVNIVTAKHVGLIPGLIWGIGATFFSFKLNEIYFPNLYQRKFFVIRYLAFFWLKLLVWISQVFLIIVIDNWFRETFRSRSNVFDPINLFTFLAAFTILRVNFLFKDSSWKDLKVKKILRPSYIKDEKWI